MNFDITEEQQLIKDSVTRFVQENYELETRLAATNAAIETTERQVSEQEEVTAT